MHLPGFARIAALSDLFEEGAMLVLTVCLGVVAALSLVRLVVTVALLIWSAGLEAANPGVLQPVFGMFFTVLIALEFKHSILVLPDAQAHSLIRMRSVLLIGMMATVRKFIVLDLQGVNVTEMLALSAAVLSLGLVYWLVRGRVPPLPQTE